MKYQFIDEPPLPYILLEPDNAGEDLPIVILLHGRGSNAEDLAGLGQELDQQSYRYVSPNAPLTVDLGLHGQFYAWYEISQRQPEDIRNSAALIEQLVQNLERRFNTTRRRMAIGGFSQGAVMAMEVGLRSEVPFAAIIAMSGYLVPDDSMKALLPDRKDRRLLIVHGTEDQMIWIQTARSTVEQLRSFGVEPVYKEYVMGHEVSPEEMRLIRRFLAESFAEPS